MSLCDSEPKNQVESMNEYLVVEAELDSMKLRRMIKKLVYTSGTNNINKSHNKEMATWIRSTYISIGSKTPWPIYCNEESMLWIGTTFSKTQRTCKDSTEVQRCDRTKPTTNKQDTQQTREGTSCYYVHVQCWQIKKWKVSGTDGKRPTTTQRPISPKKCV